MKLLMTTDTIGGVWTYSMELIGALAEHDVHVALATMGRDLSPDQRMQVAQLNNVELHQSAYKLEWMNDPWSDLTRAGQWLLSIRDRFKPDIVHLNAYAHAPLAWGVPVVLVAHSCVLSWWEAVHRCAAPSRWYKYRETVKRAMHAADVVVSPTNTMSSVVDRLYGPLPRTRVIYNGRCPEQFIPGPKHPFILSAGRLWDEAKNLISLDRAAAGLSWPVYVAGPLQHPEHAGGGHAVNARVLGFLPTMHMRQWLSRADIYALPARYEPFGLSVLEAALAGCALVLGDIPSLRESWDDAAVFASPDDPESIHAALLGLIKNPPRRQRLAAAAHTRALTFSHTRMARTYAELYRHLIEGESTLPSAHNGSTSLVPSKHVIPPFAPACSTTR